MMVCARFCQLVLQACNQEMIIFIVCVCMWGRGDIIIIYVDSDGVIFWGNLGKFEKT